MKYLETNRISYQGLGYNEEMAKLNSGGGLSTRRDNQIYTSMNLPPSNVTPNNN
jgi:hypothetical protein